MTLVASAISMHFGLTRTQFIQRLVQSNGLIYSVDDVCSQICLRVCKVKRSYNKCYNKKFSVHLTVQIQLNIQRYLIQSFNSN
jgi:hypothetical protein